MPIDRSSQTHPTNNRDASARQPMLLARDEPARLVQAAQLQDAPILIVDDDEANIRLASALLARAGFTNLHSTMRPQDVVGLVETLQPSLLLLDLRMPGLDGFAVMQLLHERGAPQHFLPILILTADASTETKRQALAAGAHDFLSKPFDGTEVQLRVMNLLRTQVLYAGLERQNRTLEDQVRQRTEALEHSRLEALHALALATEFRDDTTGQHTRRVGDLAATLGQLVGLGSADVDRLRRAAPLHDLGKIGIPDSILLKSGKLLPHEFELMQTHTTIGFDIMAPCQSATLRLARQIALTHHERWDGGGYPHGLAGELIPLAGRIVAVADAFDAMTHDRPYQSARPVADAVAEIARGAGQQFDPEVAAAFDHLMIGRAIAGAPVG